MLTITLPIYWTKEFARKDPITVLTGMSWYRNAHYTDQNRWKQEFADKVNEQIPLNTVIEGRYTLSILLYYKNPQCDGSNIVPLIEKVLLDALQNQKVVRQDSVKFHIGSTWMIAGQDKLNPRCEITIIEESTND
jgi:hypothetical protein